MLNISQAHLDETYHCPHCKKQLTCCNAPPFHVGDGLGWGSEFLYICLNDDCSLYVNGWKHISEQYAHVGSYRYMQLPGEKSGTPMMVGSPDAYKGCEVDRAALRLQNKRYCDEKEALAKLDTCVREKNMQPALHLILDEAADLEGRNRACDLLLELDDLACIDPIRNHEFRNNKIEQKINMTISQLLHNNYRKECPHCAEIIKARAKVCMHCNRDLK
ncbi:MAG: zinc ribbon domain-containing protein [Desulfobacterales bacterium]|nr:zinc ribbon domain-containing protein [Desulfobacterales bacterium]